MRTAVVIPDLELVIVIPGRDNAVVEKLRFHFAHPPRRRLRVCEIEIGRFCATKLCDVRTAFVFAIADKASKAFNLVKTGMIEQEGGLDVRDQPDSGFREAAREQGRVGKALAIPGEDVAPLPSLRVAGR